MSIYCSIFDFGMDHKPKCGRIKKIGKGAFEQDDSKPCTCGSCPIKYQGSHVLPANTDNRCGNIGIAAISRHITRAGRNDAPKGSWYPWLRFHLNRDTVVLDAKQVKEFRDALTKWLDSKLPQIEVKP